MNMNILYKFKGSVYMVPIVSFVTFNHAGLNARNLTALLNTKDDFELYIIDNNSVDDTWKFIQDLNDERIVCKKRFNVNRGLVYALNYVLSNRKKDQYFITMDSDVYIESKDWISKFMRSFQLFDELGIAAAERKTYFQEKKVAYKPEVREGFEVVKTNFAIGCCMCISPKLLDLLGYFNEETYGADLDICARTVTYTPFKIAIIPEIAINQQQRITCDECLIKDKCTITDGTCYGVYKKRYAHREFAKGYMNKHTKYLHEIQSGKRGIYCASIHDKESLKNNYYDMKAAEENFKFFEENSN